jgi:hypothetical protein
MPRDYEVLQTAEVDARFAELEAERAYELSSLRSLSQAITPQRLKEASRPIQPESTSEESL